MRIERTILMPVYEFGLPCSIEVDGAWLPSLSALDVVLGTG